MIKICTLFVSDIFFLIILYIYEYVILLNMIELLFFVKETCRFISEKIKDSFNISGDHIIFT